MTRILFLTDALTVGGSQTVLYNIVENMDQSHFEPLVLGLFENGRVGDRLRALNVRTECLGMSKPYSPFTIAKFIPIFAKYVKKNEIAIIHSLLTASGIYGGIVAKCMGIHSILNVHAPMNKGRIRHLESLSRKLNDTLIPGNRITERELEQTVSHKNSRLIYNGIKPEGKAEVRSFGDRTVKITMVANFFAEKDHMTLLRAFEQLMEKRPVHLQFVADGNNEYRDRVVSYIAEKKLDNVELQRTRAPDLYTKETDIFVLASHAEGLPISVTEAMSAGLPVVASDVGAMNEIIDHRQNGILVPAESVADLAGALDELIEDEALRRRLGENARQKFEAKFTMASMAAAYDDLYASVAVSG